MRVGFVGLGKLGLPVAVAMDLRGHDVIGYDIDSSRMSKSPQTFREAGPAKHGDFNFWLARSQIRFGSLRDITQHAEIIFVAVQTPHDPNYEGITPLPEDRADFDYSYLKKSIKGLVEFIDRPTTVVVISTVLPGTTRREILPLLNENVRLAYNPFFIAMSTTMYDFLNPEFVLVGVDEPEGDAQLMLQEFYMNTTTSPIRFMSIESAELCKVAYNTFLTSKISFANTVGEICHKIPNADVDDVINALKTATDRLISPAYLDAGMGDGGGCHPRDNIAMSWLSREYQLHFDLFDAYMRERENHARWLASLLYACSSRTRDDQVREPPLPIGIAGYVYKPGTTITMGSHALLVPRFIDGSVALIDPEMDGDAALQQLREIPRAYLIGCKHDSFANLRFAKGSCVLDPHRYIPDQEGVEVIRIGEGIDKGPKAFELTLVDGIGMPDR